MPTASVSSLQGEPRSTHDIDVVAAMRAKLAEGSEKQFGDAVRVYELQYPDLDGACMSEWAAKSGGAAQARRA